jgi:serine protease
MTIDGPATPTRSACVTRTNRAVRLTPVLLLAAAAACSDSASSPVGLRPTGVDAASDLQGGPEALDHARVHGTVESMDALRARELAGKTAGTTGGNLTYHGGTGGIGVETAPKVYLVVWGSQWNNNDPSGEVALLQSFYGAVGGSSWYNSVTQYCQGVATGATTCPAGSQFAGNPTGIFMGTWLDNASAAPTRPTQSQLAAEAVRAAAHFGNATAASNASAQYVIVTAHGNNSRGFGTQYCAYHSSTTSTAGNIAYTNLPYITDAGASCGANYNGLGPNAGITIVGGHELAETATDQFPSTGWLDGSGAENGDKCAWIASGQGASQNVTMGGKTFPVQSLWSNAFNGGAGGCVVSYP